MQWIKRVFNQFIDLLSEASRANSAYVNNVPHVAPAHPLVEPNPQALEADPTAAELRKAWSRPPESGSPVYN